MQPESMLRFRSQWGSLAHHLVDSEFKIDHRDMSLPAHGHARLGSQSGGGVPRTCRSGLGDGSNDGQGVGAQRGGVGAGGRGCLGRGRAGARGVGAGGVGVVHGGSLGGRGAKDVS